LVFYVIRVQTFVLPIWRYRDQQVGGQDLKGVLQGLGRGEEGPPQVPHLLEPGRHRPQGDGPRASVGQLLPGDGGGDGRARQRTGAVGGHHRLPPQDRKSVVQGKSVDLGGRRGIRQKARARQR